jgi:uncharacterized protein YcfJ
LGKARSGVQGDYESSDNILGFEVTFSIQEADDSCRLIKGEGNAENMLW